MSSMAEPPRPWRPTLAWSLQVLAFDEALAIPIALMAFNSGTAWTASLIGASMYTQIIGGACFLAGALLEGRCNSLGSWQRISLSLIINFALAVAGGLLAALVLKEIFGRGTSQRSLLLNLGTGVTVTILVTLGKITQSRLRLALEVSEQSLRERELAIT